MYFYEDNFNDSITSRSFIEADRYFDKKLINYFSLYLSFVLILFIFTILCDWDELRHFVNWFAPASLLLICFFLSFLLLKKESKIICTPIPWFLAASGVYFGLGPLLYKFGNTETIRYVDIIWMISDEDLLQTNMLNIVGMLTIIVFFIGTYSLLKLKFVYQLIAFSNNIPITNIALSFLLIGEIVKYGIALPYEFGMLSYKLPGSIFMLKDLTLLGLMLLGYLSVQKGKRWLLFLILLFSFEIFVDFIRFSKTALILTFIMPFLGRFLASRQIKTLIIGGVLTVIIYLFATNIVTWGRIEIAKDKGSHFRADLSERVEVIKQSSLDIIEKKDSERQSWWTRICYVPVQRFAMYLYDSGSPSNSFEMIFWTLIPRFIYPEKPVITSGGLEFNRIVFGSRSSSLGIGVFADAYYNGGYLMLLIACGFIGFIFSILSRLAFIALQKKAFAFLPCIFLGIKMGFRIDGRFVSDYFGAMVMLVAYFLVIYILFLRRYRL